MFKIQINYKKKKKKIEIKKTEIINPKNFNQPNFVK